MSDQLTTTTFREILREELNDRFAHYEKRQDAHHREIIDQLTTLSAKIDRSDEFDHMAHYLAQHLNISVEELTGARQNA